MKNNDILKLAFEEAAEKELNSLPKEGDIVRTYSKELDKKIDKLFDEVDQDKTAPVKRKKFRWAALIAAVLMCVTLTVTVSASDLTPKEMLMLMGLWTEPDPENYVNVDWEIKGAYAAGRAEDARKEIVYDGEDIVIRYVIDEGAHSVQQEKGLVLFLDGVRQKFTVKSGDEITKDTDMYVIGGKPGTVESIEIIFQPNIGKKGETLALSVGSFADPDGSAVICTSEKGTKDYHNDEDLDSICDDCLTDITKVYRGPRSYDLSNDVFAHLIMDEDAPEQKAVCGDVFGMKESPVHKKILDMYNYYDPSDDETYYNEYDKLESLNAVLYKDIDETLYYDDGTLLKDTFILHDTGFTTKGEENEKFTLNLHGKPGEYRVAFYIGTEAQPVFDGAENIDVTINEGRQTELPIELDTSMLPKGKNRYYVVYRKMGNNQFEHGWWWEFKICEGNITVE
ncbi:MAG: hypothetical protein IJN88_06630 [Clostridia bacterium]|nr:hypothetical protein [Clostridia bacterium]